MLGFDWLDPDIHGPICRLLEAYETNTRVKVCIPRGWLKTTLCSIAYPVWRAVRNCNVRVLLVQNTYNNAVSKLSAINDVFKQNDLFKLLFADILPDKSCKWKSDSMTVRRTKAMPEGTFDAAGTRTKVVSRHYDLIIEDDTVAPDLDDMSSGTLIPNREDIEQAIGWHRLASPLLVNPTKDQILVVGTRWFEEDLLSWITDNEGKRYKMYDRACREDEKGNPDPTGRITYPDRFPPETLDELLETMGPYLFNCLYLNSPKSSEDMAFKPQWVQRYDKEPTGLIVTSTIDPAGDPEDAKGSDPDYNVIVTTGKCITTGRVYVLDVFRERCSPSELIHALFSHVRQYKPVKVLVESVAYQGTLKHWVREWMRKQNLYFTLEGFTKGRKSKNAHILGLQPLFANKVIFIRPWMNELVNELLAFPLGKHDDIIDALAMHLELWALTKTVVREDKYEEDPLSFQGAVESIARRHVVEPSAPIDDLRPAHYRSVTTWAN